jgi:hypothetical protein
VGPGSRRWGDAGDNHDLATERENHRQELAGRAQYHENTGPALVNHELCEADWFGLGISPPWTTW